jgi:hypothetical protein
LGLFFYCSSTLTHGHLLNLSRNNISSKTVFTFSFFGHGSGTAMRESLRLIILSDYFLAFGRLAPYLERR